MPLQGACGTCPSSAGTMKMGIERALQVQTHLLYCTSSPTNQAWPACGSCDQPCAVDSLLSALEAVLAPCLGAEYSFWMAAGASPHLCSFNAMGRYRQGCRHLGVSQKQTQAKQEQAPAPLYCGIWQLQQWIFVMNQQFFELSKKWKQNKRRDGIVAVCRAPLAAS